jgi:mannose-1-phosphate guanylyltransferase
MEVHAVILAGGRGERFWPLSRSDAPKQMLRLVGEETLLGATLERVAHRVAGECTWIIAGEDLRPAVDRLNLSLPPAQYLWEPIGRNTAAAIGAAVERIGAQPGRALLVLPSDHLVPDVAAFWSAVDRGLALLRAGEPIVTFGLRPLYPETGYGYIERGEALGAADGAYRIRRFHEKPDAERADAYVRSGTCLWNSGIFLFDAAAMAGLLRLHLPLMAPVLDRLRSDLVAGDEQEAWNRYFQDATAVSIDHGVMEKTERVAVLEAGFEWTDLGNWTSLGDRLPGDGAGNRVRGEVLALDSTDCVLYSGEGGLLAVLGVDDLIVVRVGDATLVCPRARAQEVRRLVQEGKIDARLRRFF